MQKEKRNIVLNKGCHSRKLLSGIYNACSCVNGQQTACVEDPRLQASGMTLNLNVGQALPDNRKYIVENNSCVVGPEQQLLRTSALLTKLSGHALTYRGVSPSPLAGEGARRAGEGFPRGFTLIELLVVVLIIGILAAVALPQYQLAVLKSRFLQAKTMAHSIAQMQEIYYLGNGEYSLYFRTLDASFPYTGTSPAFQYDFPWGYCQLRSAGYVHCFIARADDPAISYQLWYKNTGSSSNRRICHAYTAGGKTANQICQSECGTHYEGNASEWACHY